MAARTPPPDQPSPNAKGVAVSTGVCKAGWALLGCAALAGVTLGWVRLTGATDGKAGLGGPPDAPPPRLVMRPNGPADRTCVPVESD
jgi:hypothetical protein